MRQFKHEFAESAREVDEALKKLSETHRMYRLEGMTESAEGVYTIFYSFDNDFTWNDEQTEEEED